MWFYNEKKHVEDTKLGHGTKKMRFEYRHNISSLWQQRKVLYGYSTFSKYSTCVRVYLHVMNQRNCIIHYHQKNYITHQNLSTPMT
jgi:hypothetical protein